MKLETLQKIAEGSIAKGDVLWVARVAGLLADMDIIIAEGYNRAASRKWNWYGGCREPTSGRP